MGQINDAVFMCNVGGAQYCPPCTLLSPLWTQLSTHLGTNLSTPGTQLSPCIWGSVTERPVVSLWIWLWKYKLVCLVQLKCTTLSQENLKIIPSSLQTGGEWSVPASEANQEAGGPGGAGQEWFVPGSSWLQQENCHQLWNWRIHLTFCPLLSLKF